MEKGGGQTKRKGGGDCERGGGGRNVAQLVDHRTVTPLTQIRFPGAAVREFLPSQLSVDSFSVSAQPRVQSRALTSVRTLEIL